MSESEMMGVMETQVPLPLLHQGKVRDVYDAGDDRLLMVASDRVSAFDVILTQPIPRKGEVLTQITAWWLDSLRGSIDHHLLSCDPDDIADQVPALRTSSVSSGGMCRVRLGKSIGPQERSPEKLFRWV
jgi:phosphoribosylaminoimidazole-succinocarboxamide synthase